MSLRRRIPPAAAAVGGLACVVAAFYLKRPWELAGYIACMLSLLALFGGPNATLVMRLIRWTVPVVIPVVLIHATLNTAFPAEGKVLGFLPWRPAGFQYGADVALNILLITTAFAHLVIVDRDDLVSSALRARLSPLAILLITQAIAITGIVGRRITNVYVAQQARGIPVASGLVARLAAFPSILIPTVIATIIEAEARAPALVSQGFGSATPVGVPQRTRYGDGWLFLVLPLLALAVLYVVGGLVE